MVQIGLIEDNVDLKNHLLERIADSNDFSCKVVSDSVEQFLDIYKQQPLDLILLDNRLEGGISGVEGLPQIKALCPEVPIIIWTVNNDYDAIFQAILSGADDFIQKDLNLDQLNYRLNEIQVRPCPRLQPPVARRLIRYWMSNGIDRFSSDSLGHKVILFLANGMSYEEIAKMIDMSLEELDHFVAQILRDTRSF